MGIKPSSQSETCNVNRHIGTAYDDVKIVADNIEYVIEAAKSLNVFLGEFSEHPTERPDGTPLQKGDLYLNVNDNVLYLYSGSTWVRYSVDDLLWYVEQAKMYSENSALSAAEAAQSVADCASILVQVQNEGDIQIQRVITEGDNQILRITGLGDTEAAKVTAQGDVEVARVIAQGDIEEAEVIAQGDAQEARVIAEGDAQVAYVNTEGGIQVGLAKDEADRATAQADIATTAAATATTQAGIATTQADRAQTISDELDDGIRNRGYFDPSASELLPPPVGGYEKPQLWYSTADASWSNGIQWTIGDMLSYVPNGSDPVGTLGNYYRVAGDLAEPGPPQPLELLDNLIMQQGKHIGFRTLDGVNIITGLRLDADDDLVVGDAPGYNPRSNMATDVNKLGLAAVEGIYHIKSFNADGSANELYNIITDELGAVARDADVVKLTGDQTVAGIKSFSSSVRLTNGVLEGGSPTDAFVIRGLVDATTIYLRPNATNNTASDVRIDVNGVVQNAAQFDGPAYLTRKDYVDNALGLKANDNEVVKLTGTQVIDGEKTFLKTTNFGDPAAGGVGGFRLTHSGGVAYIQPANTGNGHLRITKTGTSNSLIDRFEVYASEAVFNGNVSTSNAPTAPSHLTRMDYVDGLIAALDAADIARVVNTYGNQNIGGEKTFTSKVLLNNVIEHVGSTQTILSILNKEDGYEAYWNFGAADDFMRVTKDSVDGHTTTIYGNITSTKSPTIATHLTRKDYVDGLHALTAKLGSYNIFTEVNDFQGELRVPSGNATTGTVKAIRYNGDIDGYEGYTLANGWAPMGGGAGVPEPVIQTADFTAQKELGYFCDMRATPGGITVTPDASLGLGDWFTVGDAYGDCSRFKPIVIKDALWTGSELVDLVLTNKNINLTLQKIDANGGFKIIDGIGEGSEREPDQEITIVPKGDYTTVNQEWTLPVVNGVQLKWSDMEEIDISGGYTAESSDTVRGNIKVPKELLTVGAIIKLEMSPDTVAIHVNFQLVDDHTIKLSARVNGSLFMIKGFTKYRPTTTALQVVESGQTANGWYKKWSNGLIEQGGVVDTGSASSGAITFPIPFTGTDYTFQPSVWLDATGGAVSVRAIKRNTTTNAQAEWQGVNSSGVAENPNNVSWTATGF